MKTVFVKPEKCVGCKQCEIACAVEHSQSKQLYQAILEEPRPKSCIHVVPGLYLSSSFPNKCRHCDPAPCMSVCPTGAISRDAALEMVVIDGYKCITCAMCAMVCPFDVLTFYPSAAVKLDKAVAIKCDHCIDRQRQGQGPACVDTCKTGALVFGEINDLIRDESLRLARLVSVAVGEMQPEMSRIPANVEAWRELAKSTTITGRE